MSIRDYSFWLFTVLHLSYVPVAAYKDQPPEQRIARRAIRIGAARYGGQALAHSNTLKKQ